MQALGDIAFAYSFSFILIEIHVSPRCLTSLKSKISPRAHYNLMSCLEMVS